MLQVLTGRTSVLLLHFGFQWQRTSTFLSVVLPCDGRTVPAQNLAHVTSHLQPEPPVASLVEAVEGKGRDLILKSFI